MVILNFPYSTLLIFTVAASRNMPPSVQPPAIVGCGTAILSRQLIIISANFTGRTLAPRFLTVLLRFSEGLYPAGGRFGGPVSRISGKT